jgi:heme/copper-type cytochrome/quinol oxidase subunit 2
MASSLLVLLVAVASGRRVRLKRLGITPNNQTDDLDGLPNAAGPPQSMRFLLWSVAWMTAFAAVTAAILIFFVTRCRRNKESKRADMDRLVELDRDRP